MPALFPRWSDTWLRIALIGGAVALAGAVIVPIVWVRTPYAEDREFPVDQPVQFDHRHHVRDDGIECQYCHREVERSPYASIPSAELCMNCHNQVWPDSPMLEPVRRAYFSGFPLAWNRVHRLPDFVYFNHAIHISGGIACASCHGRVEEMALDYQVSPLTMGWCLGCHRRQKNARELTNCTACHR